eukprot:TRINITY_DN189_c0_g1_i1.p1 TRINITY_DN189_c0_g1~~TRINITY_DN189_c0_g1_i1.p1  ORF type:complete len:392 (+),score=88.83 TRINITY_DN189_c0_g1_i1:223-1398(+)
MNYYNQFGSFNDIHIGTQRTRTYSPLTSSSFGFNEQYKKSPKLNSDELFRTNIPSQHYEPLILPPFSPASSTIFDSKGNAHLIKDHLHPKEKIFVNHQNLPMFLINILNEHRPDFELLNLVAYGYTIEDLDSNPPLHLPWCDRVGIYPRRTLETKRTQRDKKSLEECVIKVLEELKISSNTREELVNKTGFDRRRLSACLVPLEACGLISETGVVKKKSKKLMRNKRFEMVCMQISRWSKYYFLIKKAREELFAFLNSLKYLEIRLENGEIEISDVFSQYYHLTFEPTLPCTRILSKQFQLRLQGHLMNLTSWDVENNFERLSGTRPFTAVANEIQGLEQRDLFLKKFKPGSGVLFMEKGDEMMIQDFMTTPASYPSFNYEDIFTPFTQEP